MTQSNEMNWGASVDSTAEGSVGRLIEEKKAEAAQSQPTSHSAMMVPSMSALLSGLETQTSLSEAGITYLNTLRTKLEDNSWGTNFSIKIKTHMLNDPANTWAFVDEKRKIAVVTIFIEDFGTDTTDADARMTMFHRARKVLHGIVPTADILNIYTIFPEDYDRVQKMIVDIKNSFICEASPTDMSLASFGTTRYSINTNADKVRAEVERMSPHGIQPHAQFGFTIDIIRPKTDGMQFFGNNQKKEYETTTIVAVTGRTRIVGPTSPTRLENWYGGSTASKMFQPIVEITGIFSPFKNPEVLALVLPVAQQIFIMNQQWRTPYLNFGNSKHLDVGNLLITNDGNLVKCEMRDAVNELINVYFNTPYLAINIPEGRSRIRGLEWLTSADTVNTSVFMLNKCYADKYKEAVLPNNIDIATFRLPEFIGVVTEDGVPCDSRVVEFLNIVKKTPTAYQEALPLRGLSSDTNSSITTVRNYNDTFKPRYISNTVVLNYNVLNRMTEIMNQNINVIPDGHNVNDANIDIINILNQANGNAVPSASLFNNGSFGSMPSNNMTYGSFLGFNR